MSIESVYPDSDVEVIEIFDEDQMQMTYLPLGNKVNFNNENNRKSGNAGSSRTFSSISGVSRLPIIEEEVDEVELNDRIKDVEADRAAETKLNILNLEDNVLTNFQIVKLDKEKQEQKDRSVKMLLLKLVRNQQEEHNRRHTKASLARQRKIRELYP